MTFWIGILVGAIFAWFAIKMRFYETWAFAFNIVISIYLAISLQPVITDTVPAAGDAPYRNALIMIATAIGSFLILHGIVYIFLTSQFRVPFPKVLDTVAAGLLGFAAGFLVWSFIALLIYITPISQNTFVKKIGFGSQFQQTSVPVINWWCNLVNTMVSHRDNEVTSEQTISELLKSPVSKLREKRVEQAKPSKPAKPDKVETRTTEKDQLGPPPEADFEDI